MGERKSDRTNGGGYKRGLMSRFIAATAAYSEPAHHEFLALRERNDEPPTSKEKPQQGTDLGWMGRYIRASSGQGEPSDEDFLALREIYDS